jgi:hypothetical protein
MSIVLRGTVVQADGSSEKGHRLQTSRHRDAEHPLSSVDAGAHASRFANSVDDVYYLRTWAVDYALGRITRCAEPV